MLGHWCSELETSTFLLGHWCSELETSTFLLDHWYSELETSTFLLGHWCSELETPSSELEFCPFLIKRSPFTLHLSLVLQQAISTTSYAYAFSHGGAIASLIYQAMSTTGYAYALLFTFKLSITASDVYHGRSYGIHHLHPAPLLLCPPASPPPTALDTP
ncbi:MAG: hypothetical protein V7L25_08540 [Nostoc sp.]|uniref:hypothetical protein n=1 Tax=Nostoc sp. TaxID=1180 RepID=UPI002FEF4A65